MIAHIPGVREPPAAARLNLLHRGQNAHADGPNQLLRHPNIIQTALVVVRVVGQRGLLSQHRRVGRLQREQAVAGGESETADEVQRVVGHVGMEGAAMPQQLVPGS